MMKRFWQNLGMKMNEVKNLTNFEYEMFLNIMYLEEQNQLKGLNKQNARWQKRY